MQYLTIFLQYENQLYFFVVGIGRRNHRDHWRLWFFRLLRALGELLF